MVFSPPDDHLDTFSRTPPPPALSRGRRRRTIQSRQDQAQKTNVFLRRGVRPIGVVDRLDSQSIAPRRAGTTGRQSCKCTCNNFRTRQVLAVCTSVSRFLKSSCRSGSRGNRDRDWDLKCRVRTKRTYARATYAYIHAHPHVYLTIHPPDKPSKEARFSPVFILAYGPAASFVI